MPYIKVEDRERFNNILELVQANTPNNAGELNYLITMISIKYLQNKNETYQSHNDILGALTGCSYEFYRRSTSKYEDEKIIKNQDVY